MSVDLKWFEDQDQSITTVEPTRYESCKTALEDVFAHALARLAPQAIVQVRTKSVPSFAEKIIRKQHKYRDPLSQLTDLCGARIIVHTKAEVGRIGEFIRGHFAIDNDTTEHVAARLKPTKIGCHS